MGSSTLGHVMQEEWEQHYADDRGFRHLGDSERALLAEHTPAPEAGGRALDLGCGTGDLAAYLADLGYHVDAVDFADSAIARAKVEHAGVEHVRWLRLDIERDDPAELNDDGYDLITLRLVLPFLHDRTRILHSLGERLRPGGAIVVITPTLAHTPKDRRDIALEEDEISLLAAGWTQTKRLAVDGLAALVLRGPCRVLVNRSCSSPSSTSRTSFMSRMRLGLCTLRTKGRCTPTPWRTSRCRRRLSTQRSR
jgi:protein-L-isoaspartate(D-aspartate) O-methyltransferase